MGPRGCRDHGQATVAADQCLWPALYNAVSQSSVASAEARILQRRGMDRIGRVARRVAQGLANQQVLIVSRGSLALRRALGNGKLHGEVSDHIETADEVSALMDDHRRPRIGAAVEESRTEGDVVELRVGKLKAPHRRVGEGRLARERPILEKFRGLIECRLNEAEYLTQPRQVLPETPRIAVQMEMRIDDVEDRRKGELRILLQVGDEFEHEERIELGYGAECCPEQRSGTACRAASRA